MGTRFYSACLVGREGWFKAGAHFNIDQVQLFYKVLLRAARPISLRLGDKTYKKMLADLDAGVLPENLIMPSMVAMEHTRADITKDDREVQFPYSTGIAHRETMTGRAHTTKKLGNGDSAARNLLDHTAGDRRLPPGDPLTTSKLESQLVQAQYGAS